MINLTSFLSGLIQPQWIEQKSPGPTISGGAYHASDEADAIVVGSGINGLVAAAELA
jgi:hypothetical protein